MDRNAHPLAPLSYHASGRHHDDRRPTSAVEGLKQREKTDFSPADDLGMVGHH
jgi:hypothetical protein